MFEALKMEQNIYKNSLFLNLIYKTLRLLFRPLLKFENYYFKILQINSLKKIIEIFILNPLIII